VSGNKIERQYEDRLALWLDVKEMKVQGYKAEVHRKENRVVYEKAEAVGMV